jgi:hypothetical protein
VKKVLQFLLGAVIIGVSGAILIFVPALIGIGIVCGVSHEPYLWPCQPLYWMVGFASTVMTCGLLAACYTVGKNVVEWWEDRKAQPPRCL